MPLWTAALLLPPCYGFCEAHCPLPQLRRSWPRSHLPGFLGAFSSLVRIDVHIFLQSGGERDWTYSVPWTAEEETQLASLFEESCPVFTL